MMSVSAFGAFSRSARPAPIYARPALWLALWAELTMSACGDQTDEAKPGKKEPTTVGVLVLKAEAQALSTELPGRTVAVQAADVRPQVSGIIRQRLFNEGETVKAGQALYQIDARTYEVAVASAKAAQAKAQAAARLAALNFKRNADLVKQQAVSQQVFEESQAAVQQTAAELSAAQAALAQAQINLDYTRIVAPIGGRVGLSNVTLGALVTANQAAALTQITQLDPMHVDITQSSTEVLRLQRDLAAGHFERLPSGAAQVRIVLEDGSVYPHAATLKFEGVNVNTSTGAITLRAQVPNPDRVLLPGMYVRASLTTGLVPNALLVPQQAVKRELSGKASVLVVTPDSKVEHRPIEVAEAVGQHWRVRSGVKAGEAIVMDGLQRIKPGDTVKTVNVADTGADTGANTEAAKVTDKARAASQPASAAR
jgi:membrane fusion protein (multidrug efflux system)